MPKLPELFERRRAWLAVAGWVLSAIGFVSFGQFFAAAAIAVPTLWVARLAALVAVPRLALEGGVTRALERERPAVDAVSGYRIAALSADSGSAATTDS
ncbi:MAG: hypothetical protein M3Y40_09385 [Chloroflexota bacterium]|nr:hypothetical protein [Chloroflexota bacterium]